MDPEDIVGDGVVMRLDAEERDRLAARAGVGAVARPAIRSAGFLWLAGPKLRARLNRAKAQEGGLFKGMFLGFVTLFFCT